MKNIPSHSELLYMHSFLIQGHKLLIHHVNKMMTNMTTFVGNKYKRFFMYGFANSG